MLRHDHLASLLGHYPCRLGIFPLAWRSSRTMVLFIFLDLELPVYGFHLAGGRQRLTDLEKLQHYFVFCGRNIFCEPNRPRSCFASSLADLFRRLSASVRVDTLRPALGFGCFSKTLSRAGNHLAATDAGDDGSGNMAGSIGRSVEGSV